MLFIVLLYIIWFGAAIFIIPEIVDHTQHLNILGQILLCIVVIIGVPFLFIAKIINCILDLFLDDVY